jgi:hypothetical protein
VIYCSNCLQDVDVVSIQEKISITALSILTIQCDNAMAESFMKTLKSEEDTLNEYETFSNAKENVEHFINLVYNNKRFHSAIGHQTPVKFEASYINSSTLFQQKYVLVYGFIPLHTPTFPNRG